MLSVPPQATYPVLANATAVDGAVLQLTETGCPVDSATTDQSPSVWPGLTTQV